MSEAELAAFLDAQGTIVVGTNGPDGRPHLTALWYVPSGTVVSAWTYAKSQKVRNLERDPRATLLAEDGATYEELRGVMLHCAVEVIRDTEAVTELGFAVMARYAPGHAHPTPEVHELVAAQAPKRVGLVFTPASVATWDHAKLAGTY